MYDNVSGSSLDMADELNLQVHFAMEKGRRDSDRLVQNCLDELKGLLHNKYVEINGTPCQIKVIKSEGNIMFDIEGLEGFDHIEFCINKTGWGRWL